jgi:hypothetical protein
MFDFVAEFVREEQTSLALKVVQSFRISIPHDAPHVVTKCNPTTDHDKSDQIT